MKSPKSIHLSGADAFILALEGHKDHHTFHDQFCHYFLELTGEISPQSISEAFNKKGIENINSMEIKGRHTFVKPYWNLKSEKTSLKIEELSDLKSVTLKKTIS